MKGPPPSPRLTKIVCTIGPACGTPQQMAALADAGMSVARVNLSHGTAREQEETIRQLLRIREKAPFGMSVMLDTRGAEIRTGDVQDPIPVAKGEEVLFVSDGDRHVFDPSQKIIRVNYDGFAKDVGETERILIDNGELTFDILSVSPEGTVRARAREDGKIGNRRHVNLPGADINLPSVTERDWADIALAVEYGVDFLALSFIRTGEEVASVRRYLDERKSDIQLITKVETQQAVRNIDELIRASDAIMVARGDLGAEVPFEQLPVIQDDIVARCRAAGKPVIVATHMLESMTHHPLPTRAEVTDVAHAANIQTDAVMLSGETAGGRHPLTAVDAMDRIVRETEAHLSRLGFELAAAVRNEHEARAEAAVTLARSMDVAAILVITRTGRTARDLAKFRPLIPVIAITDSRSVQNKLTLSYGVFPLLEELSKDLEKTVQGGLKAAVKAGLVRSGDAVVLLSDTLSEDGAVTSIQLRTVNGK